MCEVFTSILARNQGGMRDFLQASLRGCGGLRMAAALQDLAEKRKREIVNEL